MPIQLTFLYSLIKQHFEFVFHAWRDRRVPPAVRVVFLLALLYVFSPFDCLPDCGPGGYLDDLTIAVMMFLFVQKVVPRVVFQDARRAAKHAACGIVFLSFTSLFHLHAAQATTLPEKDSRFVPQSTYACCRSNDQAGTAAFLSDYADLGQKPLALFDAVTAANQDKLAEFSKQKLSLQELRIRNRKDWRVAQLSIHGGQTKVYDASVVLKTVLTISRQVC